MSMNSIVNDFRSAITGSAKKTGSYDSKARVIRVDQDTAWVHIYGGIDETPVQMSISAKEGDEVRVRVSDGRAWIIGNDTAPPVGNDTVQDEVKKAKKKIKQDVEEDTTTIINQKIENITVDDPRVIKVSHDPIITHHSVTFTIADLPYYGTVSADTTVNKWTSKITYTGKTELIKNLNRNFDDYNITFPQIKSTAFKFRRSSYGGGGKGLPVNVDLKYKIGSNGFASPTFLGKYACMSVSGGIPDVFESEEEAQAFLDSMPSRTVMDYDNSGLKWFGGYYRGADDEEDGKPLYRLCHGVGSVGSSWAWRNNADYMNGTYDSEHYFTPTSLKGGAIIGILASNNNSSSMAIDIYDDIYNMNGFSGIQIDFDLVDIP